MRKTLYFCDSCGEQVLSDNDFYLVKAAIHKNQNTAILESKEVCESCVKETGYDPNESESNRYIPSKGLPKMLKDFFKR